MLERSFLIQGAQKFCSKIDEGSDEKMMVQIEQWYESESESGNSGVI